METESSRSKPKPVPVGADYNSNKVKSFSHYTRRPKVTKVYDRNKKPAWEDESSHTRYRYTEDGKYVATAVNKNDRLRPLLPSEKVNVLKQGFKVIEDKTELTVTNADLRDLFIEMRDLLLEIRNQTT